MAAQRNFEMFCTALRPLLDSHPAQMHQLDALLVPGGWAPDKLRRDENILQLVREMNTKGKILGFICHAGWVAASAGICNGKRATGSTGIKDDLENAGAVMVEAEVVAADVLSEISRRTAMSIISLGSGPGDPGRRLRLGQHRKCARREYGTDPQGSRRIGRS